jgi:4-hydroxythreonine-4-phosphate dehydrogenase
LAGLQGAEVAMMLANDELRSVLVTIHLPLAQAIGAVTRASVLRTIRLAHRALEAGCRAERGAAPRIAVAGLNPHAGEGGLFGDEEAREIAPAIADARAEGIDASGPGRATPCSRARGTSATSTRWSRCTTTRA